VTAGSDARTPVTFTLRNTGVAAPPRPGVHPDDAAIWLDSDVYRLTASIEGEGWSVLLPNELAAIRSGAAKDITAYVTRGPAAAASAALTLRAVSESDPAKSDTIHVRLTKR
jgi:hypothetical protein